MKIAILIFVLLLVLALVACNAKTEEVPTVNTYKQITPAEAKALMGVDAIILDVRTEEEFAEGHIEGAILIPDDEITDKAPRTLPDKDALILVYCRSGRRSKLAADALVKLGYTNVQEFGGIIDWPYEVVK